MNSTYNDDKPGTMKVPNSQWLITFLTTFTNQKDFPFLSSFRDKEGRKAYLMVRTKDMPADEYIKTVQSIVNFALKNNPGKFKVTAHIGIIF